MINLNKVKMLAKLANFEKQTKKTKQELEAMTKNKYIANGIWWTFVTSSTAFLAVLVLKSLCLGDINTAFRQFLNDPFTIIGNLKMWIFYIIFEIIFLFIALVFYNKKFDISYGKLEEYKRRQINYNEFYNKKDK